MATTGLEVFDKTLHTTNLWLDEINAEIGPDRHLAWHVLGAVLRSIRDEMQVEQSAHFAAQLPLLIRGAYFDQYRPAVQPASARSQEDFIARIQHNMDGSRPVNVQLAAAAVMRTLNRHVTEGQVRKVRDALPRGIRAIWPECEHRRPEHKEPEVAKAEAKSEPGQGAKSAEPSRPAGQPAPSGRPAAQQRPETQHAAQPSAALRAAPPPSAPQPPVPQRSASQHSAPQSSEHGEWEDIDVEIGTEEEETTSIGKSQGPSAHVPIGTAAPPAKIHAAPAVERTTGVGKTKPRAKHKDD